MARSAWARAARTRKKEAGALLHVAVTPGAGGVHGVAGVRSWRI